MKILFVEPPYELFSFNSGTIALFEPLGLETVAAAVPEHDLRLVDLRVEKNEKRALDGFEPDVCAFACHSYATLPSTLKTMERYRRLFPRALTVVGGHSTLVPELFNRPAVDAIVMGEGEETFPELVNTWGGGRRSHHGQRPGAPEPDPKARVHASARVPRPSHDGVPIPPPRPHGRSPPPLLPL